MPLFILCKTKAKVYKIQLKTVQFLHKNYTVFQKRKIMWEFMRSFNCVILEGVNI